jgi:hypothetical protein
MVWLTAPPPNGTDSSSRATRSSSRLKMYPASPDGRLLISATTWLRSL